MKKIWFLLFVFLPSITLSYAQITKFQPELTYGVNGGVTLSSIRFDSNYPIPQDKLLQSQFGLTIRYIAEKNFGLQAELNYSNRGWKETTDEIRTNRYTRSISYIEMPFMTHIYFSMGKRVRGLFNLGPQIGYCIGEKTIERVLDFSEPNDLTAYYFQDIQRKFDYGIVGGGGIEFQTGIGNFILEGRYYFGLSDIFNNMRSDRFQSSANQVIGIKLSYLTSFL